MDGARGGGPPPYVPDWVGERLERLVRQRLAVRLAEARAAYRFSPADAGLERSVEVVAEAFRTRRTAMISLIYARAGGPARLSDAFRFQEGEP